MFYSSALARIECFCGSKEMSSLMSPTSQTDSVKVKSRRNLVRLTKNSCFELSLTVLPRVPDVLMGYAYRGTYSRHGRRISIPELIIGPLTCENS